MSYRGNMHETDDGKTMYRPSLRYGQIFSHRAGTGFVIQTQIQGVRRGWVFNPGRASIIT